MLLPPLTSLPQLPPAPFSSILFAFSQPQPQLSTSLPLLHAPRAIALVGKPQPRLVSGPPVSFFSRPAFSFLPPPAFSSPESLALAPFPPFPCLAAPATASAPAPAAPPSFCAAFPLALPPLPPLFAPPLPLLPLALVPPYPPLLSHTPYTCAPPFDATSWPQSAPFQDWFDHTILHSQTASLPHSSLPLQQSRVHPARQQQQQQPQPTPVLPFEKVLLPPFFASSLALSRLSPPAFPSYARACPTCRMTAQTLKQERERTFPM